MKIVTAENGKKRVKISKSEWESIGKKHGWMKTAIESLIQTQRPRINSVSKISGYINEVYKSLQQALTSLKQEYANNPNMTPEEMTQRLASFNYLDMNIVSPLVTKALSKPDGAGQPVDWGSAPQQAQPQQAQ